MIVGFDRVQSPAAEAIDKVFRRLRVDMRVDAINRRLWISREQQLFDACVASHHRQITLGILMSCAVVIVCCGILNFHVLLGQFAVIS